VVRGEDHALRRGDDVEAHVLVRQALGISDVEADVEALFGREAPRRLDHARRHVLGDDPRTSVRRAQGYRPRTGCEVHTALSSTGREPPHELGVKGRQDARGDVLPRGGAPDLGLLGLPAR
jgi:hypothetical protein